MNNRIFDMVTELMKNGRLPHAILIDSGSAADRDELALHIASSFICESTIPCGICKNCTKIKNGAHPDVIVFDPEQRKEKVFKVDFVREIRADSYIMPNEARCKVYILKNTDKMNASAQNAFLKTLEEPPSYARFILLCESRAALLETIMSRVTPFNLGAEDRKITNEYTAKADELANKLAVALTEVTELNFMRLASAFEKDKDLLPLTLASLQLIFRDAVAVKTGSNITLSNYSETSNQLALKFPLKTLITLVENTEHFFSCINKNANKNLLITRFCSVLRSTAYGG